MKAIPVWLRGALRFSPDIPDTPPPPPPPQQTGEAEQQARAKGRRRYGRAQTILHNRGNQTLSPTGDTLGAGPAAGGRGPGGGLTGTLRPTGGPMDRNFA